MTRCGHDVVHAITSSQVDDTDAAVTLSDCTVDIAEMKGVHRQARTLYAHSTDDPDETSWQTLSNHSCNVAELAGRFASAFDARDFGELLGLVHDAGKASALFQQRLAGRPIKVDHSTAGGKLLVELFDTSGASKKPGWGTCFAYAVLGHHGGLPNGRCGEMRSSLFERLGEEVEPYDSFLDIVSLPDASVLKNEIPSLLRNEKTSQERTFGFTTLLRMLFSCLVDADYLDTEAFLDSERSAARHYDGLTLEEMRSRLHECMGGFPEPSSPVNQARADIHKSCADASLGPTGVYSLCVPTGGGKTLASLDFALSHAVANGHDRVIYAIPYTSITEQTASTFKRLFGDDSVLEHHCNYEFDEGDDRRALHERLEMENWDCPLVVTTNVQLFESMYSDKPSRCRKNHNLANSVIVLDEVQSIPDSLLKPCLYALDELVRNYGATVVLCSATIPSFESLWLHDVKPIDLVPPERRHAHLFDARTSIENIGEVDSEELLTRVAAHDRVLCVVSTRKAAGILFDSLVERVGSEGVFHLSALMVPAHRSQIISEIRHRLSEGLACRVISTQLIEAGVDLDFPVVFREVAGIDSILQAAGRCNREGRLPLGHVYVFDCPEYAPKARKGAGSSWLPKMRALGLEVIQTASEPFSDSGVQMFFKRRFQEVDTDSLGVARDFSDADRLRSANFPFEACGREFRFIDDRGLAVFVPWGKRGAELLDAIRFGQPDIRTFRAAQRFTLSIPPWQFNSLRDAGEVSSYDGVPFWVLEPRGGALPSYSNEKGLFVSGSNDDFLTL